MVTLSQEDEVAGWVAALGQAALDREGRFEFNLDLESARARRGSFEATLLAAGFEPGQGWSAIEEAEDGFIDLSFSVEASTVGRLATGRVVDAQGKPVAGAVVYCVHWRELGAFQDGHELQTRSDGGFSMHLEGAGWMTMMASATAHGVARAALEVGTSGGPADLGTLVLRPRSVLSGQLVDPSGVLIPGRSVEAFSLERGEFEDSVSFTTDLEGRFTFRTLAPGEYSLATQFEQREWDELPSHVTGTTGIRLVMNRPTLRVMATTPSGARVDPSKIRMAPLDDRGSAITMHREIVPWTARVTLPDLSAHFVVQGPGDFMVSAYDVVDGIAIGASKVLSAKSSHHAMQLELLPVRGRVRTLRVVSDTGVETAPWRMALAVERTGIVVARLTDEDPTAFLPDERLLAIFTPVAQSYADPFEATLELDGDAREEIILRTPSLKGLVEVQVHTTEPGKNTVQVQCFVKDGPRYGGAFSMLADGQPRNLPGRFVPGEYVIVAELKAKNERRGKVVESTFHVIAGRTVQVSLTLP